MNSVRCLYLAFQSLLDISINAMILHRLDVMTVAVCKDAGPRVWLCRRDQCDVLSEAMRILL